MFGKSIFLKPPTAPPNTTNLLLLSIDAEQWAALFVGGIPEGFRRFQYLKFKSHENKSPVILYFPVSPVAPPNKMTVVLLI